jgi:hypothetical protein
MHDDDLTMIGERIGYGGNARAAFGIRRADRRHHLYALGKTGTGKSTLLERLILQDIEAGEGVALLDPHGDTAERLLDFIPPWRTDHLCYFDPADLEHPVGFNILAGHEPERRHLAVSGVVSAFKGFWGESWGPRLEYILVNAVAALMERPGATLLQLPRLLTDPVFRELTAKRLTDPVVRRYWQEEFAGYDKRLQAESAAPVLNKIGQLFTSPMMRNIFGQEHSAFDPRFLMDKRRILIANLSRGRIGADKSDLIGSLLVSALELAGSARADQAEADRPDFYLYADEFQHFATDSFASILSEARKYRLCLSLFHQFEDQLPEPLRRAVFGNVGTIIAFRVGQRDAEHLARELENDLTPADLTGLDRFQIAVRLLERGRQSVASRAMTKLPEAIRYGSRENLVAQSRMRFGRAKGRVERAIQRGLG